LRPHPLLCTGGSVQYISDLPGGQVVLAVSTITPALPHVQSWRLRPLGVPSATRSSAMPDVPTIAEQGLPGFDEKPWTCFVTTAGWTVDAIPLYAPCFKAYLGSSRFAPINRFFLRFSAPKQ
jgi:tripartite-type tricarboxylate transporter receptor subunit TctC